MEFLEIMLPMFEFPSIPVEYFEYVLHFLSKQIQHSISIICIFLIRTNLILILIVIPSYINDIFVGLSFAESGYDR